MYNEIEDIHMEEQTIVKERKTNLWDTLGKVVAIYLTLVYALFISNSYFHYLPVGGIILSIISYSMLYGPMILIIITCMEALKNRSLVLKIIFLAVWVVIFIFSFFPSLLSF